MAIYWISQIRTPWTREEVRDALQEVREKAEQKIDQMKDSGDSDG
jgi:hypothetical protein